MAKRRTRKHSSKGLRKARCVKKQMAKGKNKTQARRKCHVKK